MHQMVRRTNAVAATIARYEGKAFAWGSVDCAKMAAFHFRQMGHHQNMGLSKAGSYKTALSAKRALARLGHDSLPQAIDALGFARIAPAEALPGDLLQLAGEHDLAALGVVVGNGRTFAFHEDTVGPVLVTVVEAVTGWRVTPRE